MRAPVLLVFLALASTISAVEIPISQPDVIPSNTMWPANAPEVAAGDGYLATWSETHGYYTGEIKVRTWDLEGRPRQTVPATIGFGGAPHAYWNGEVFVVVYSVSIGRFGSPELIPAVVARHVDADGNLIEGSERAIVMSKVSTPVYALAWNGTNALVAVFHDSRHRLILLDGDGAPLRETVVDHQVADITVTPDGEFYVLRDTDGGDVAIGGGKTVILKLNNVKDGGTIAVIRDSAGTVIEEVVLATGGTLGSIVWDGTAFVSAYTDHAQICTARFTGAADLVRSCRSGGSATYPAITAGPRGTFRAWKDGTQILTDAGLASTELSTAWSAAAAVDERGLVTAWTESNGSSSHEIRVGGINDDGTLRPEYVVDTIWPFYELELARGAKHTLLAWQSPSYDIRVVSLNADGTVPTNQLSFRRGFSPVLAPRGEEWLLVWGGQSGIESVHLDGNLQVGQFEEFGVKPNSYYQVEPAVAATPNGYLVVWHEAEMGFTRVVVEPVDAKGKRYRGGNRLFDVETSASYPQIACNSEKCLVSWFGNSGELWYTFVNFEGDRIAEDRLIKVDAITRDIVIKPSDDGSFTIYRSGTITRVDASGHAGPTQVWSTHRITLGDVVTFRGRTTAVYSRADAGKPSRVYAFEFIPRARAVRR